MKLDEKTKSERAFVTIGRAVLIVGHYSYKS